MVLLLRDGVYNILLRLLILNWSAACLGVAEVLVSESKVELHSSLEAIATRLRGDDLFGFSEQS